MGAQGPKEQTEETAAGLPPEGGGQATESACATGTFTEVEMDAKVEVC